MSERERYAITLGDTEHVDIGNALVHVPGVGDVPLATLGVRYVHAENFEKEVARLKEDESQWATFASRNEELHARVAKIKEDLRLANIFLAAWQADDELGIAAPYKDQITRLTDENAELLKQRDEAHASGYAAAKSDLAEENGRLNALRFSAEQQRDSLKALLSDVRGLVNDGMSGMDKWGRANPQDNSRMLWNPEWDIVRNGLLISVDLIDAALAGETPETPSRDAAEALAACQAQAGGRIETLTALLREAGSLLDHHGLLTRGHKVRIAAALSGNPGESSLSWWREKAMSAEAEMEYYKAQAGGRIETLTGLLREARAHVHSDYHYWRLSAHECLADKPKELLTRIDATLSGNPGELPEPPGKCERCPDQPEPGYVCCFKCVPKHVQDVDSTRLGMTSELPAPRPDCSPHDGETYYLIERSGLALGDSRCGRGEWDWVALTKAHRYSSRRIAEEVAARFNFKSGSWSVTEHLDTASHDGEHGRPDQGTSDGVGGNRLHCGCGRLVFYGLCHWEV